MTIGPLGSTAGVAMNLPSYWRRAIETTTPVEFILPANTTAHVFYADSKWVSWRETEDLVLHTTATHYITLNADGTTTRIERPAPVVTRGWETPPPNDDAPVICKYEQGGPAIRYGSDIQTPGSFVAYALFSDLITAPPASVVEVTWQDVSRATKYGSLSHVVEGSVTHRECVETARLLNAELRAKRPTPVVVTAEMLVEAHNTPHSGDKSYVTDLAASLTRQLNGGAA